MTKANKKGLLIVGVIVSLVAVYFLFFKGKSLSRSLGAGSGVEGDEAAYSAMDSYLRQAIGSQDIDAWLGKIAKEFYTGQRSDLHPDYLVDGKVTRTGAYIAAWASSYYGYGYDFNQGFDAETVNERMYSMFYAFKGKVNRL